MLRIGFLWCGVRIASTTTDWSEVVTTMVIITMFMWTETISVPTEKGKTMREKLIEILRVPIYPHELADPAEVVADYLLDNGVVVPVHCKDCKHWLHMEDGMGDCTNSRFHLPGHADPTMKADDFCSCGERRTE